jgi:hypothetical protein
LQDVSLRGTYPIQRVELVGLPQWSDG